MALIDYKIRSFSHDKRSVKVAITIYRGSLQTVTYTDLFGQSVTVPNTYVRIAKVRDLLIEYDVPRDMTRREFFEKAQAYLNDKIVKFATANGHTVITQQTDKTGLEPVINEKEI